MSVYNRRLIFVYMDYLKQPIVLYAGNYFRIGLEIFAKVSQKNVGLHIHIYITSLIT